MNDFLLASYLIEATGALVAAAIFGGFYREYHRGFLRDWALSWAAMVVMLGCAALSVSAEQPLSAHPFLQGLIAATAGAAGFMAVVWLLLGSTSLVGRPAPTVPERRVFLAGAIVAGIALSLVPNGAPASEVARMVMRASIRGVITGLAFLVAAVHVRRAPGVRAAGRRLVMGAFVLMGLIQFVMLVIRVFLDISSVTPGIILSLGFAQFVFMFAAGLGVVIWLLEEQHVSAAENAQQVQELALTDPLTGLPNRKLFLDHLDMAIPAARRAQHKLAVLFIDLDRFKLVNDSLGHAVGDKLLQLVATRLRAALRETDTIARMGGDEFTVLAPVIHSVEDAISLARKVRDAVKEVVAIEGRELFVTASIGIGIFPDDGADANTLLRNADAAMYRAKAQGSDVFQLYTAEMNSHAIEQLALESALRRAVENLEFVLHYQPIVRTADGSVYGMEAMLRWRHPVLGLVSPEQFIRMAESTGMIVPIGQWALDTACRQLAEWRREGYASLCIAVNLSTRQLQQSGLVELVRGTLDTYKLPPSALDLEVNESSASQSNAATVQRLADLKAMGVNVSIDDFGTGYTSLASLRSFPADTLKIDTSFTRNLVRDQNDTAVASAVLALAHSLDLVVVAEGVEHPRQLEFLSEHQCKYWQGYLCSAPVDAAGARVLLRRMAAAGGRILSPTSVGAIKPG
ncbi:MAG TPA: EAL domain-containing protein [Gemmatimonadaceae bacterium]|nr:EAL domain-containing protein [Gemmatimonadaceae bacterium]